MRRFRAIAAAAAVLAIAAPCAFAADGVKLSPKFDQCIARANGETPATMDCQSAEFDVQDKRLNAAYRKLLAKLTPSRAEQLKKVQRSWLAYVDGKCAFYWDADNDGQLERVQAQYCSVVERARRAEELEGFVRDQQ